MVVTLIPDFIGFSGNKVYNTIAEADITRAGMTSLIVSSLTSVGWTIISGPTPADHGDEYEVHSDQSPWWDENNTPDWYVGGRIYLHIFQGNSTRIGIRVGEFYNGAVENEMPSNEWLPIWASSLGFDFHVFANPYQCFIWHDVLTNTANADVYFGALNVPKALQQREKVISTVVLTTFKWTSTSLQGDSRFYHTWRSKDTTISAFSNFTPKAGRLGFSTVIGRHERIEGRRIWDRVRDPTMSNNKLWKPFAIPARVSYQISGDVVELFYGFIWDAVVLSEGFTWDSATPIEGKNYRVIAGSIGETNAPAASLWINID